MSKTYYNDAVIGNSKILGCITRTGELVRLFWPNIDYPQHIERFYAGIRVKSGEESCVSWFHDNTQWQHRQEYITDTNILKTTCTNAGLGIKTTHHDYAVPGSDIVVRSYEIENTDVCGKEVDFAVFSSLVSSTYELRSTLFDYGTDSLIHYRHGYYIAIAGDAVVEQFQIGNNPLEAVRNMNLNSYDDVCMCPEAAVMWRLGEIAAGGKKRFTLCICMGKSLNEVRKTIEKTRKTGADTFFDKTRNYWTDVLKGASGIKCANSELDRIYKRSILVFKLMQDGATGGLIAAPELDEEFTRCGGYAYCWCRDAGFIASAMDACGLSPEVEMFYDWAARVQDDDGSWFQRYYVDGNIAPGWGMQVDETGTILWGILQHYKKTGSSEFLKRMWNCVKKGADFLAGFVDNETGLVKPSRDLWEERFGEHAYSAAAVYGGLRAASEMCDILNAGESVCIKWDKACDALKESIEKVLWDDKLQCYLRSIRTKLNPWGAEPPGDTAVITINPKGCRREVTLKDNTPDISLLGLTIPFKVFDAHHPRIEATAAAVEKALACTTAGGLMRYANDGYVGGNPWIVATLWIALYHIEKGNLKKAKDYLEWAVRNRTGLDLLPEQVDRESGGPAWVIPLTWSHAMFVLVLKGLIESGEIG